MTSSGVWMGLNEDQNVQIPGAAGYTWYALHFRAPIHKES